MIVNFPSRRPRRSKNGTPEERAAKAAAVQPASTTATVTELPRRAAAAAAPGPEPIFALIGQHRVAQAECERADDDDVAATDAKWAIEQALAQTRPTTLAEILAIMRYERELSDRPLEFAYDLFDFESRHAEPPRLTIRTWLTTIEQSIAAIAGEAVS
jgi:hypothetical protein